MDSLIRHFRDSQAFAKLIGEAPVFLAAIGRLPEVARSEAPVLIAGETGTGKELVARAIHYLSERDAFPFVPANCGSFPETLLEDELFGHERGAFTGAHAHRQGLIAEAEKGTLFLDEVDTLSAKAQIDLLRVLQDKTFRPIGSSVERLADVRIVAATNAPVDQLLRSGAFRKDLYYRLSVFRIDLPPLRERKGDALILATHFLRKHAPIGKQTLKLTPAASAALMSCCWPGNVRELENAIIRGIHLSRNEAVDVEDLRLEPVTAEPPLLFAAIPLRPMTAMKRDAIEAFEKGYLARLMSEHQGNVSRAARAAGKERRDLGKLLKKYHLDPRIFRPFSHPTAL